MQVSHAGGPLEIVTKTPLLTEKDAPEYQRIRNEIFEALKRMGGYEPAIDDLFVDQIARTTIYLKKIEFLLDSELATSDTYASVTDSKLKMGKTIENAIHQLSLSRRDRIGKQTQAQLENVLREELERVVMKNGDH